MNAKIKLKPNFVALSFCNPHPINTNQFFFLNTIRYLNRSTIPAQFTVVTQPFSLIASKSNIPSCVYICVQHCPHKTIHCCKKRRRGFSKWLTIVTFSPHSFITNAPNAFSHFNRMTFGSKNMPLIITQSNTETKDKLMPLFLVGWTKDE